MSYSLSDGLNAVKKMQVRTSCRSFLSKEIPADLLDEILKAGLQAPSGGNLQPVTVIKVTDPEKNTKLMEMNGNQKFIGEAPVNLLFFLDWNKMGIFAANEKAPFTCTESYKHFLIGLEDVICMAQIIDTAANLCGLGSCYVGTVNSCGDELCEMFNMPKSTYPVVMLSLGYPKAELKPREKLSQQMMIFENSYPQIDNDYVINEFRNKYKDMSTPLPKDEVLKNNMINSLRESLLTSYSSDEVEAILEKAIADSKINETQRRFGLHYHAKNTPLSGKEIIKKMKKQGLDPFKVD